MTTRSAWSATSWRAGGSLFTTDWALRHVVQPGFPGTIEHAGRVTADDVVPIEVLDHDNPFLAGVMDGRRAAVVARRLLVPDHDRGPRPGSRV